MILLCGRFRASEKPYLGNIGNVLYFVKIT